MSGMTTEKLAAIEALEQAATPGPWAKIPGGVNLNAGGNALGWTIRVSRAENAEFIAASREAVPFLLALVRDQANKLAKVEAEVSMWEMLSTSDDSPVDASFRLATAKVRAAMREPA